MKKLKIVFVCMLIPFFVVTGIILLKIKNKDEFRQKTALAYEIRKVLGYLMFDLSEAQENSFIDLPPDGQWHKRIAVNGAQQGDLEYLIKDGHLFRVSKGVRSLIADNIGDLRIRRQKDTPDIVEVQIEARMNVSLISNLRIRTRE